MTDAAASGAVAGLLRAGRVALGVGGVWLVGMGVYFIALRPPLLPEDERFVGASLQEAIMVVPNLAAWLTHVFRVLGGFAASLGLLVGWSAWHGRSLAGQIAHALVALIACSWMVAVNFAIGSDFRWVLLAALMPWFVAIVALLSARSRLLGRQPARAERS